MTEITSIPYKKVLTFDIGIKNLAFCILEGKQVLALENVNLLEPVETISCSQCKAKATYQTAAGIFCGRHKKLPVLPAKSHTIPSLKELVKTHQLEVQGTKKEHYITALQTVYAFPFKQAKQANASHVSLELLHDALRAFVTESWPIFQGCTQVLLENQPAFKNPHMKSVQVLLFATLREQFLAHQESPTYRFVHAKKKVGDAPAGDAGYAERKDKSEARLISLFDAGTVANPAIYVAWKGAKKKSDMADALCMAVDAMV
jgi:hypothetical protein